MGRRILSIISLIFLLFAGWFLAGDLMATNEASRLLGDVWFEASPASLQVSEAIISRYIDPCGLIVALGCSPFLWHPVISTLLLWPAAFFFLIFSGVFFALSRLFQAPRGGRKSASALKREGR